MKTTYPIHMIGNAHIDIVWLWDHSEGVQTVRSSFRSAVDRIDETDDFVFTSACAYYYQLVEEIEPELFARIKAAVATGRWFVGGGWWLQPDCNLPSGEAFARQALLGQRYFAEKLGVTARVGYNVDSFGHHGNMPQILRKAGLDSYVFMRPGAHEKELPASAFRWEGIDGSAVSTFRIPPGYNNTSDWGPDLIDKIRMVVDLSQREQTEMMAFFGVGNHGGGPTKENIENIRAIKQQLSETRQSIAFSTPQACFDSINADSLPTVRDELQYHAIGCYSAMARVKRENNHAEQALTKAEKILSVFAPLVGLEYPADDLRAAWTRVLVNHFHDAIGGCSIPEVYPHVLQGYGYALETARAHTERVLHRVAARIATDSAPSTAVVWNPHSWDMETTITLNVSGGTVVDTDGREVPSQIVESSSYGNWFTHRILCRVKVPTMGYASYRIVDARERLSAEELDRLRRSTVEDRDVSTAKLDVRWDWERGVITGLTRTDLHTEVLSGLGMHPVIVEDLSDTWSHGISKYDGVSTRMALRSLHLVEDGALRARYRCVYDYGASSLTLDVLIDRYDHSVELRGRVVWQEHRKILKLRIETALATDLYRGSIPFGWIDRPTDGTECPVQRWIDLEGVDAGLCVINDGLYSCDVSGGDIGITILRSPAFAHHEPAEIESETDRDFIDQGDHEFRVLLIPHAPGIGPDEWERRSLAFNQPVEHIVESAHTGALPLTLSLASVDNPAVVIQAVKRSEDETRTIIRAVEASGKDCDTTITIGQTGTTHTVHFGAFEIKTLSVTSSGEFREEELTEGAERLFQQSC